VQAHEVPGADLAKKYKKRVVESDARLERKRTVSSSFLGAVLLPRMAHRVPLQQARIVAPNPGLQYRRRLPLGTTPPDFGGPVVYYAATEMESLG